MQKGSGDQTASAQARRVATSLSDSFERSLHCRDLENMVTTAMSVGRCGSRVAGMAAAQALPRLSVAHAVAARVAPVASAASRRWSLPHGAGAVRMYATPREDPEEKRSKEFRESLELSLIHI